MKPTLLVLPLALLVLVRTSPPHRPSPESEVARVRAELDAVHAEWDRARTSFDTAAFERMLAPDFWVEIGPTKLTRAQFIEEISGKRPGARLVRFESETLTLSPEDPRTTAGAAAGVWVAVVEEKLEVEGTAPDGKARTSYSLWITKDRFRKDGERWLVLSSQAIGWESWGGGEKPPFDDWSS